VIIHEDHLGSSIMIHEDEFRMPLIFPNEQNILKEE
jgi:hypothetical protein